MRVKKYISIFLTILFAVVSCKKDHNTDPKTNMDVYVAGHTYASNGYLAATYWKNGVPVVLTDSSVFSEASAIAIQGTDVYVAGYIMNSNHYTIAAYWKNSVLIKLGNDNSNSKAYGIALQGK